MRNVAFRWRCPSTGRCGRRTTPLRLLEAQRSDRCVAAYLNTPSNPSGRVVPADWLEAIAAWAEEHDLWLLSDEVYAEFVYGGAHHSLAAFAPERTVVADSFSKSYGVSGNRVGALLGPAELLAEAHKVSVHSAYHAPTAAQHAALRLLEHGQPWIDAARTAYGAAGEDAAKVLGLPAAGGLLLPLCRRPRRPSAREACWPSWRTASRRASSSHPAPPPARRTQNTCGSASPRPRRRPWPRPYAAWPRRFRCRRNEG